MPLTLRWGSVTAVTERLDGLIRLEVDGAPCIAYPRLTGPVEEGDTVIVNTQARELGLGSGGFDVVHANLTRGLGLPAAEDAHVMTLPYTPGQLAFPFAEETDALAQGLDSLPVVCCSLHSQLAPVCAGLAGARVAYVQLGGGALPVSLSDAVRTLKERGLLGVAIAASPCLDGDVQCATPAAALAWAAASGAETIVCAVGPGIVGTGSELGHGGLAIADAANAAAALGARPIVAPRVSLGDPRERHQGLSHHTLAALDFCLGPVVLAWPLGLPPPDGLGLHVVVVDVEGWEDACAGLPLEHMGRGPADDPWFFMAAYAAGLLARWELGRS
ncbi:MAG TPA: DUF3866 family protein [Gaiellaceae bacterium]|jgi:hypothetical protein